MFNLPTFFSKLIGSDDGEQVIDVPQHTSPDPNTVEQESSESKPEELSSESKEVEPNDVELPNEVEEPEQMTPEKLVELRKQFLVALEDDDLDQVKTFIQLNLVKPLTVIKYTIVQNLPKVFKYYLDKIELDLATRRQILAQICQKNRLKCLEAFENKYSTHQDHQSHYNSVYSDQANLIEVYPINIATYENHYNVVDFLIKHQSKCDLIHPKTQLSTIHLACQCGNDDILKLLCENTSNLNLKNSQNNTPLHVAAFNGYLDCVQTLVENGADSNLINKKNLTPIDLADQENYPDIVTYLKLAGAQLTFSQVLEI